MTRSAQEIQEWMIERLSRLMGVPPRDIDPREPIRRYGLDSVALVNFTTDLEDWLVTPPPPQPTKDQPLATSLLKAEPLRYRFRSNPLDDHPTVEALAAFLVQELAKPPKHTGKV